MTGSLASYTVLDGKYKIHETIGTGGFGKVKKAVHVATGEKVAIKVMDKKSLGDDLPRTKLEIEALRELNHQNIGNLYEVIETPTKIFLVLEYCSGGELFDYIVERDRLEEVEARHFFRQIVAAVAYIHTKGFAHRDLKPENLLLDEEQNIKLIDFGLCAKPKGGMGMRLETFCGSPAYAAPELINGQEYLGSQVDIWSMGVLLYALLCGYLPFDDDNVGSLYRKIQTGKYDCPSWLSEGSRMLLSKMLVTNPRYRITVGSLLIHPWLNEGYSVPVVWSSIYKKNDVDLGIVNEMSIFYGKPKEFLISLLQQWKYDYMTATYFLLLLKQRKGRPVRLVSQRTYTQRTPQRSMNFELGGSLESGLDNADLLTLGSPKREQVANNNNNQTESEPKGIERPKRKAANRKPENERIPDKEDKENFAIPTLPTPSNQRRNKGRRAKVILEAEDESLCQPFSPIGQNQKALFQSPSILLSSNDKKSHSVDTDLHLRNDDPITVFATPTKDGRPSSAKKVFGSIEKSLDRVKNMLTPRKWHDSSGMTPSLAAPTPRKVKSGSLYNVSVIRSYQNADTVLETLRQALEVRGIPCKQKGYTLRNKLKDDRTGKVMLEFELEICRLIQGEEMLCICRKRLKGDTWLYKHLVEEILRVINNTNANSRNKT